MFQERRKSKRVSFNRRGRIQDDLTGNRTCTIVDLSADGARLCLEGPIAGNFVLSIDSDAGEQRKTCSIIWRVDDEIGVQFA